MKYSNIWRGFQPLHLQLKVRGVSKGLFFTKIVATFFILFKVVMNDLLIIRVKNLITLFNTRVINS